MGKNALLVIDVQEEYMQKYPSELISAINQVIDQTFSAGDEILYVKNIRRLKSGETSYDLASSLRVCSQNVLLKRTASIFQDAFLSGFLREHGIEQLTIVGIDGCCCVAKSAEDAASLGYRVTIPLKAVGVQNLERFAKKRQLLSKLGIKLDEKPDV